MKVHKVTRAFLTVEVDEPWRPSSPHAWGQRAASSAREVAALLKAANITCLGEVGYEVEAGDQCSLCNSAWEVDEAGCPQCCQKAVDEWQAAKEVKG